MVAEKKNPEMVGGFNPLEKYACQFGSFPQVLDEN